MFEIVPSILKFVPTTLFLSVVSMFFAIIIGLIVALIKRSQLPILSQLASLYISLFRWIIFIKPSGLICAG